MSEKGLGYLYQVWQAIKLVLWPAICSRASFVFWDEKLEEQDNGSVVEIQYHTIAIWKRRD